MKLVALVVNLASLAVDWAGCTFHLEWAAHLAGLMYIDNSYMSDCHYGMYSMSVGLHFGCFVGASVFVHLVHY